MHILFNTTSIFKNNYLFLLIFSLLLDSTLYLFYNELLENLLIFQISKNVAKKGHNIIYRISIVLVNSICVHDIKKIILYSIDISIYSSILVYQPIYIASIPLSIYLYIIYIVPIYLSIYISSILFLSIYLYIYHQYCSYLSIYLSIYHLYCSYLSIYLSIYHLYCSYLSIYL